MSICKFTLSAPGKVILFGEHSVLYSKPALATAINKRTFAYFETGKDEVELDFRNLNIHIVLSSNEVENCLENIAKLYRNKNGFISLVEAMHDNEILEIIQEEIEKLNGFERYNAPQRVSLKCVFYLLYFLLYFQNKVIGSFKITISSELTIGAGTGSSASFSVCLAATLYKYSQFLFESNFNANEAFSTEQKSVINNWAFACEQIIHGKASGIDNFVCTYGSMITISFTNDELGKIKPNFKSLDDTVPLRILLVNSGINRNTAMMVKKVGELHKRNSLVINHIFQAFGEITTTAANVLSNLKNIEFEIYSEKYKKLFERLEDLVSINHGLLISIGVSHPTLNSIVEIGASCGLKGKLTGAGGGGYAFILVPPYIGDDILDKCKLLLKEGGYGVEDATMGDVGLSINSL